MVVKESLGTQLATLTVWPVETKDSTLLTTKLIIPDHHAAVLSMSHIRGGADKSLARPTSRCRRIELTVSLERWVGSCAELQVFSCYRG